MVACIDEPVNVNLSIIIQTGQKIYSSALGSGMEGPGLFFCANDVHTQTPYVRCSSGQDANPSHGTSTEKVAHTLFIYIQQSKGGNNIITMSRNSASVLSASCTVRRCVWTVCSRSLQQNACLNDWQIVHIQNLHQ